MKHQHTVEWIGSIRRHHRITDFHCALQSNPAYFKLRVALQKNHTRIERVHRSSNKVILYQAIPMPVLP